MKKKLCRQKNYTIHFIFIFYENIGFDKNNNFSRTDFCVKFKKKRKLSNLEFLDVVRA